jgi:hypothetical protein
MTASRPSVPLLPHSIAFLNFGMTTRGPLEMASGILLAAEGILMFTASFKWPRLFAALTAEEPKPAPPQG